jgi:energy-coupling factor transport system ATP-binding protein
VLALDEPSSNLDIAAVDDLRRLLAMWKSKGKTIVIAEHRLYYLREIADRIVYMKNGSIEAEYTAAEFMRLERKELAAMGLRPLCLETLEVGREPVRQSADSISVSDFRFSYRNRPDAVYVDSVRIPQRGATAIVGPNGAGKTTFAKCLCGLNKGCKGCIEYGAKIRKGKRLLDCCHMVMQDVNHQLFTESVLDEVLLSLRNSSEEDARAILSRLDLLPLRELHPMSLSGGQKQRVAIASAVAAGKDIVILDEPTSGLDLKHMREVVEVLRGLRESGKTLIIISHDLEFIMESCTYALYMNGGRVTDGYPLDREGMEKLKAALLGGDKRDM